MLPPRSEENLVEIKLSGYPAKSILITVYTTAFGKERTQISCAQYITDKTFHCDVELARELVLPRVQTVSARPISTAAKQISKTVG